MKSIIVFGMGNYARKNWIQIVSLYNVVAVLDNKIEIGKCKDFHGVKAVNPQDYLNVHDYPILVMVKDYISVTTQLMKMGVDAEKIMIFKAESKCEGIDYATCSEIEIIKNLPAKSISRDWGYRRGTPIGRKYIECFLETNRQFIRGDILEVAETTYSEQFSDQTNVHSMTAIHVNDVEGCRKANLETGEGLGIEEFDTMIITQTLAYIYDLKAAVHNIYNALRSKGNCFITVTDIGHMGENESEKYGCYWGFHRLGITKLFAEIFGEENVCSAVYGNIKTVTAQLYGLAAEDIPEEYLYVNDDNYPMIIGIRAYKE